MVRGKQTARKSTGGKAPRSSNECEEKKPTADPKQSPPSSKSPPEPVPRPKQTARKDTVGGRAPRPWSGVTPARASKQKEYEEWKNWEKELRERNAEKLKNEKTELEKKGEEKNEVEVLQDKEGKEEPVEKRARIERADKATSTTLDAIEEAKKSPFTDGSIVFLPHDGSKNNNVDYWCQSAGGASYGMSNGLKYVVVVGVLFLTSVCLSSIFFLPTIGNEYIAHEIAVPNVHDPHFRRKAQERDVSILKKKVEEADILPPPIPQPEIGGGDDSDARRVSVKEMMKFAWDGYRKYAWGANELRPISKTGHSASIFGSGSMGATIVDAIDTLWLMGLREEYEQARTWIKENLDFKKLARGDISVFETNIRFVGGLLAIYALTNDKMFLEKAEDIAKILLPAFETPSGIPYALVNVQTGSAKNYGWASGGCSILSEFGSIQLEFDYLSNATGNPIYAEKAQRIRDVLSKLEKPDGLYPMYLHPQTGKWGQRDYSLGAMADSFYEYLLKQWVATGKQDDKTKREYEEAIFAMEKKMLFKSEQSGLWYFANLHGSRVEHKMEHLACFAGGMFVLHAANEQNLTVKEHYMDLGAKIGDTCHESYNRSAIGIGPEAFRFTSDAEAKAISIREKYYMLRPEVVETWFYLWRYTRDEKYRNWAWSVVEALEKYSKSPAGYSGIEDVYSLPVSKDDVQQSFLLAELFKYLYLIFAEDSVLPLDRWVLNTEAHPLPIRQ